MEKRFTEFSDISAAREEVRRRHPSISLDALTWAQIRDLANGDLVPVKCSGKRKYVLMSREDVAPGGALEKANAVTRAANAEIRARQRLQKADTERWIREKCGGDIAQAIRLCFPKKGDK